MLVLFASVGLTVQRHTCRVSGRSQVAVAMPGQLALGGCGGRPAPVRPAVKDSCCDFSSHVHKLPVLSQVLGAKMLVPAPLLVAWLPVSAWPAVVPAVGRAAVWAPRWFAADSSPPPRGGRGLLAFVCALVV